jgi:Na+-driven multidrug efflux pump
MWLLSLGTSSMSSSIIFWFMDLDFPEMGIVGAAIGTIVSCCHVSFMHYILIRKPNFIPILKILV